MPKILAMDTKQWEITCSRIKILFLNLLPRCHSTNLSNFELVGRQFMDIFLITSVPDVIGLYDDHKVLLHVARVGNDRLAVRISVPRLLVYLQRALGSDQLDEPRYLRKQSTTKMSNYRGENSKNLSESEIQGCMVPYRLHTFLMLQHQSIIALVWVLILQFLLSLSTFTVVLFTK